MEAEEAVAKATEVAVRRSAVASRTRAADPLKILSSGGWPGRLVERPELPSLEEVRQQPGETKPCRRETPNRR